MKGHLRVLNPGFLATVQDSGRWGYGFMGVSPSGAADLLSLEIGNRILKNPPRAAALELTLLGGEYEFLKTSWVCLTGADFSAHLNGSPLPRYTPTQLKPGDILKLGSGSTTRGYLCVSGGVDVPLVMGSFSTHLMSHMGGFKGRALKEGDILSFGHFQADLQNLKPLFLFPELLPRKNLRVTLGLDSACLTHPQSDLFENSFRVGQNADRLGIRLAPKRPLQIKKNFFTEKNLVSKGISTGTVQVTSEGLPMILFVEQQTTGGYPQILSVIEADHFSLGQLKPGDEIQFKATTFEEALEIQQNQRKKIEELFDV